MSKPSVLSKVLATHATLVGVMFNDPAAVAERYGGHSRGNTLPINVWGMGRGNGLIFEPGGFDSGAATVMMKELGSTESTSQGVGIRPKLPSICVYSGLWLWVVM